MNFNFIEQIKEAANKDPKYLFLWQQTEEENISSKHSEYGINEDNILIFRIILHVPNPMVVRHLILDEFNKRPYATHPRYEKIFIVVKSIFVGLL